MSTLTALADSPRWPSRASVAGSAGVMLLSGLAVVEPTLALAIPLALGYVLIAFRNLAAGLVLFTLLISLEYVPGLGGDVGVIKAAGAVLVAAWAMRTLRARGDTPLLLHAMPWPAWALIGLVVWSLTSSLWAADSSVALSSTIRLGQGVVLVFVVYAALRTARHLSWIVGAYVVGALASVGFGLASPSPATDAGRLAGAVGDPNELAAFLVPAVMLCAFAYLANDRALARWLYLTSGVFLLVAVFLTGSRGGLVALAVSLVAAVGLAGRERVKTLAALLVIVGCGVGYLATAAASEQIDRLATLRYDGGTGRSDIWSVAWETVRDRPVLGVGAGNFPVVEGRYATRDVDIGRIDLVLDESKVVHNTYLSFLSELGGVGFALFAFMVLAALWSTARAVRRREGPWDFQLVLRGFATGLIGMLVAFTFFSAQYEKQLWLLVGIAFALPSFLPGRPPASARVGAIERDAYHRNVSRGFADVDGPRAVGSALPAEAGTIAALRRRLRVQETELARLRAALASAQAELGRVRERLDEATDTRDDQAARLAELTALVRDLRHQAELRQAHDEREKTKLRARIRALQRRADEVATTDRPPREQPRARRAHTPEPAGDEPGPAERGPRRAHAPRPDGEET